MTAVKSNEMVLNRKPLGQRIAKGVAEIGGSMTAGASAGFVANSLFPNLASTALTTAVWKAPFLSFGQQFGAVAAIAALPPMVTNLAVPAAGALIGLAGLALVKGTAAAGKFIGAKIQGASEEKSRIR